MLCFYFFIFCARAISVYTLKRTNKITITFADFIKKYKYSTFSYTTKLTKDWKDVLLLKHLQEKVDSKSLHIFFLATPQE